METTIIVAIIIIIVVLVAIRKLALLSYATKYICGIVISALGIISTMMFQIAPIAYLNIATSILPVYHFYSSKEVYNVDTGHVYKNEWLKRAAKYSLFAALATIALVYFSLTIVLLVAHVILLVYNIYQLVKHTRPDN